MNKADKYCKEIMNQILEEGCLDKNPRPHYEDSYIGYKKINEDTISNGIDTIKIEKNQKIVEIKDGVQIWTPAHTYSINHISCSYDLSKGEFPLITLRPIAVKNSIAELLWIYQKQSNDLVLFDELIGKCTWDKNGEINNWWKDWAIMKDGKYALNEDGHPHIGACYGETIRRHNLIHTLLDGLKKDPDGRRQIISMWQVDDFNDPHGLKPCAYQTTWNVRHGKDNIDYLDMCLFQRSSDYATAGCINQVQYAIFLMLIARHLGYVPGKFTWFVANVQIYDRHITQVKEMLKRNSIECSPSVWINPEKTNFFDFTVDDIKIINYPREEIKEKNPQLKFELGI